MNPRNDIEKFISIIQGKYLELVQILATFLKSITAIIGETFKSEIKQKTDSRNIIIISSP